MRELLILLLVSFALAQDSDQVCFYRDVDYQSTQLCAIEGKRIDVYSEHSSLNDQLSSVKVPIGLQVVVFFDAGFVGTSTTYQEDTTNLGSFSDQISSFIVEPAKACFYKNRNYGGDQLCVSVSDMVDLPSQEGFDNTFGSVKIPPGLLVKLFTDAGFQGRFTWITTDSTDLGDFDDDVSSVIVEYDNQVCFYTDVNYEGTEICARPGEKMRVSGTNNNDAFSSLRVPHDLFVQVYYHAYYGKSRLFTADASNFGDFNDQISSFVVGFSGTACFYTENEWSGNRFCAPYGDKIDIAANFNSFNDKFQSIVLPDDLQVKAYMHSQYKGRMVSYQTTNKTIGDFSDEISSFEVTVSTTTLYDNFPDSDVSALQTATPFNLTVCSFVNNQGTWRLQYNNSCHSGSKRYACNDIYTPNLWQISSQTGVISDGMSVCQSEFGSDYIFGTPKNTHSNSILSGLAPSGGVWINLYYDSFNNVYSHRMRRSTDCGGLNQRACTFSDSIFQSWICATAILNLFACQDPYCNDGLSRVKIHLDDPNFVCQCPTNHRVRRGVYDYAQGACAAVNVVPEALAGNEILQRLLIRNSQERAQLQTAWTESFLGRDLFQERGGWIYANPNDPTDLRVVLAPRSASGTFRSAPPPGGGPNPSINLETGAANANVPSTWVLVANFHTHPLQANPEPSPQDLRNAHDRGVPGIVISSERIYVYGPSRRANFQPLGNPRAYPNDGDPSNYNPYVTFRLARENPFPRPDSQ